MALILSDRVKETTTTTGTGTYTLGGAVVGFESFASIGNSNTTYYCCTNGTDFEVGIGTYTSSGTTLARTTILQSSNSDSAVNWSAGTKEIFCTLPAEKSVFKDANDNINIADNKQIKFGDSDDLQIFHNGNNSFIKDFGTGALILQTNDLKVHNAGLTDMMIRAIQGNQVELYYDNGKKFETTSTGATVTGNLELTSTDAGASSAPLIELYRHSASPAVNDFLGRIDFYGEDDNDDKIKYASITSSIFHPTNGNERGRLEFDLMQNGSMITFIELVANGINLNKPITITGDTLITNSDGDADADPTLNLRRTSASPAFNDQLGEIKFQGRNDNFENVNYGRITTKIGTVTDGNEGGNLSFNVLQGGSEAEFMSMSFDNIFAYKQLTMFNNIFLDGGYGIKWDGSTNDSNTTTLVVTDPTAVRTITLPDATGTVLVDDGSGNVTVSGNFTVSGTTTTVNSSTLSIQDPLIILANNNNSSDVVDIGFYGLYDTSGSQDLYAGLFRDASDSGKFKLFKDLQVEPTTTVNTSGTGYAVGTLVSNLELTTASQIVANSVGNIPFIEVKGTGPNFIRFLDNESVTNGVNLVYRVTPHDLRIERSFNSHIIAEFGGDDGHAALYHANIKKLETTSTGATITGELVVDDLRMTTGANSLLKFTSNDGSEGYQIKANVSNTADFGLLIEDLGGNDIAKFLDGGAVELYYNHVKKFETRSNGFAYIDSDVNIEITNQSNQGAIEIGGTNGAFIDLKSPQTDDFDARIQVNTSNLFAIYSDDLHLASKTAETYLDATANGAVNLYYDNVKKFETTADGIKVTGPNLGTSDGDTETVADFFINNGNGSSLRINKIRDGNGSNWNTSATKIQQVIDTTHQAYIQFNGNDNQYGMELGTVGDEKFFRGIYNGAVELYHNNVKKFETSSAGATVNGDFTLTKSSGDTKLFIESDSDNDAEADNAFIVFKIDGGVETSAIWTGNFGGSNDNSLNLTNAGQFSRGISFGTTATNGGWETATERMRIARNGDITTFGTNGNITFDYSADSLIFDDNVSAFFGTGSDLKIFHNGSNSFIREQGTGNLKLQATNLSLELGDGTLLLDTNDSTNSVQLHDNGELRLRTSDTGIDVLCEDSDSGSDNTANIRIISEGLNEIVTFRSNDGTASYISRNGDNYGTHLFQGFGTVTPNTINMLQLTSTGHTSFQDLTLESTDTGASVDPSLILYRNSDSPADSDDIGEIIFRGRNDNSQDVDYIQMMTDLTDVSDGTESAQLIIKAMENGTLTQYASFNGGGGQIYFSRLLNMQSNAITGVSNIQFSGSHSSDSNTQIKTEQSVASQTSLVLQTGDDATANNEDDVRIRHRNYGNVTPQDLDMAIFKRNVSDNTKADITFNGDLTLLSTDAGATAGPTLSLYRNSASPTSSDDIGQIQFFGENDADEKIEYARIDVRNSGVTDGGEYGQMDFMVLHNGSEMVALRLSFNLVQFYRDLYIGAAYKIQFEGSAYNDFETSLTVAGPTADRTITLPDASGTVALKSEYFQAYISSDSAALTSGFVKIDFDTVTLNSDNSILVESGGEVTINKAGIFRFSADVTTKITSGSSRSDCEIELQKKPSGGTFSSIAGTTGITYNRNLGRGEQTSSINFMINVTSGDTYRVAAKRQGGGDTIVVQGGAARFNIQEVN